MDLLVGKLYKLNRMFTCPTKDELLNGYTPEKIKFLKEYAIHDVDKLVYGKKYVLLTNGYYLGTYDHSEFVCHIDHGMKCECNETIYNFIVTNSARKTIIQSRSSDFIKRIGIYEVTY